MAASDSSSAALRTKPEKPYPDYPLFAHARGKWAKKIRGKLYYFGRWEDPQGALDEYNRVRDDLYAGRPIRRRSDLVTVKYVCDHFLTEKKKLADNAELSPRSFSDYRNSCIRIADHFGRNVAALDLTPDDFSSFRAQLAETRGPISVGNEVQRVRTVFKHAYDHELIDRPVRFGPGFRKPNKKTVRLARAAKPKKLLTADEILGLIDEVGVHLVAMVYFGINCGFGNSDCAHLPLNIDWEDGWLEYVRPKTGMPRRAPLWPETVAAMKASLRRRPKPQDEAKHLFFVTRDGKSWGKSDQTNPISKRTTAAFQRMKVHRTGMSFYWLRHTFRTIADEVKDQPAADLIMGHARDDMPSNYRQEISDKRLLAVTDHVRAWLFGEAE